MFPRGNEKKYLGIYGQKDIFKTRRTENLAETIKLQPTLYTPTVALCTELMPKIQQSSHICQFSESVVVKLWSRNENIK